MNAIRRLADSLIRLSAGIGCIGLLFEVLIILADVIGRSRFIQQPLLGSQDLITMTMVIVVFGGMALCDKQGGHISIDIFEAYFPSRFNHTIDTIAALMGTGIFALIAWAVYQSAKLSLMLNLSTNLLNLPKAWFQWSLCGFAILTAISMLLRAITLMTDGPKGINEGSSQ